MLQERHMEHVIDGMRITIDRILEIVSLQKIQQTKTTNTKTLTKFDMQGKGVWLASPMCESTFERVEPFLTPAAKRRHISQVYNIDIADVDLKLCALPVDDSSVSVAKSKFKSNTTSGTAGRITTKEHAVENK